MQNNDKVYWLKLTRRRFYDGWRDGGETVDVARIPASGGVPEAELKNLIQRFIFDGVSSPTCDLVFDKKHVAVLSDNWDSPFCSGRELAGLWNNAQPNMQIEVVSENVSPPFPIKMRVKKDRKNKYHWVVSLSEDEGQTWRILKTSDDPEEAQKFYLGSKETNPSKRFALAYTRVGDNP
jgi:hypothetical protein